MQCVCTYLWRRERWYWYEYHYDMFYLFHRCHMNIWYDDKNTWYEIQRIWTRELTSELPLNLTVIVLLPFHPSTPTLAIIRLKAVKLSGCRGPWATFPLEFFLFSRLLPLSNFSDLNSFLTWQYIPNKVYWWSTLICTRRHSAFPLSNTFFIS